MITEIFEIFKKLFDYFKKFRDFAGRKRGGMYMGSFSVQDNLSSFHDPGICKAGSFIKGKSELLAIVSHIDRMRERKH